MRLSWSNITPADGDDRCMGSQGMKHMELANLVSSVSSVGLTLCVLPTLYNATLYRPGKPCPRSLPYHSMLESTLQPSMIVRHHPP